MHPPTAVHTISEITATDATEEAGSPACKAELRASHTMLFCYYVSKQDPCRAKLRILSQVKSCKAAASKNIVIDLPRRQDNQADLQTYLLRMQSIVDHGNDPQALVHAFHELKTQRASAEDDVCLSHVPQFAHMASLTL